MRVWVLLTLWAVALLHPGTSSADDQGSRSGWVKIKTDKGCLAYLSGTPGFYTTKAYRWSEPCATEQPISGTGRLAMYMDGKVWVQTGRFVAGYLEGMVTENKMTLLDGKWDDRTPIDRTSTSLAKGGCLYPEQQNEKYRYPDWDGCIPRGGAHAITAPRLVFAATYVNTNVSAAKPITSGAATATSGGAATASASDPSTTSIRRSKSGLFTTGGAVNFTNIIKCTKFQDCSALGCAKFEDCPTLFSKPDSSTGALGGVSVSGPDQTGVSSVKSPVIGATPSPGNAAQGANAAQAGIAPKYTPYPIPDRTRCLQKVEVENVFKESSTQVSFKNICGEKVWVQLCYLNPTRDRYECSSEPGGLNPGKTISTRAQLRDVPDRHVIYKYAGCSQASYSAANGGNCGGDANKPINSL